MIFWKMNFMSGFTVLLVAVVVLVDANAISIHRIQKRESEPSGTDHSWMDAFLELLPKLDREQIDDHIDSMQPEEFEEFLKVLGQAALKVEDLLKDMLHVPGWDTDALSQDEKQILEELGNLIDRHPSSEMSQFLKPCKYEYMNTDFNQYDTVKEAANEAMRQILSCVDKGWRHIEDALLKDISGLNADVVKNRFQQFMHAAKDMKFLVMLFKVIQNSVDLNYKFKEELPHRVNYQNDNGGQTNSGSTDGEGNTDGANQQTNSGSTDGEGNTDGANQQTRETLKRVNVARKTSGRQMQLGRALNGLKREKDGKSLTRMLLRLRNNHK